MALSVTPEWVVATPEPDTVSTLASNLECSQVLASALVSRGVTDPETARELLDPTPRAIKPPTELPDLEVAVDRLELALDRDEPIAVIADRDVDGITGGTALVHALRGFGADVTFHAPGKYDGYGLSRELVDAAEGAALLVTVDCGTADHEAIEHAIDRGLDVVVTDHHNPPDRLPAADAVVNPRRSDPSSPLAGGAVAWKLGQALVEAHDPLRIEAYHRDALPLAAVATLGDYMPLTVENRAIVREGVARLDRSRVPGLVALARHCNVESPRDLGWSLVPLLNAAQEDESGTYMHEVLLAESGIDEHLETLETYREVRREERAERRAHLEAAVEAQLEDPAAEPVIQVDVDRYVGGGAMSAVAKAWCRPVIAYREDGEFVRGGGRTAGDVNLLELYEDCSDLLVDSWGHPGAGGFHVDPADREAVRVAIAEAAGKRYDLADLRPSIEIDCRLEPAVLDVAAVEELERLGPFGSGNDEPQFLLEGLRVREVGRFGDEDQHVRLESEVVDVVCWGGHETLEGVSAPTTVDVVGPLSVDDFTGRPTVTLEDCRVRS